MWSVIVSGLGLLGIIGTVGILLVLAYRSYAYGPEAAEHDPSQFGGVLAGRYAFMAVVFVCALLTGTTWLILLVLGAISALGFWDAHVYGQAGLDGAPHLQAGILGLIALVFVWLYLAQT